ncbi:hypothetical protein L914_07819 [Phytophthora nicotianae]|uniref:EF-hand domain-containing protein n=1 Tax=Phytophthora nicotianae TaxID=4792 RepID=W2NG08_PHYNI|nr:hypothetical protein L914_07819 [Phytophthora nicotianae]
MTRRTHGLLWSLVLLWVLIFVHVVTVNASEETKDYTKHVEQETEADSGRITLVAAVTVTILIAVSIFFEVGTEMLYKTTDEANIPFLKSVFNELTTLGFIGLLLFVVSQLEMMPRLSSTLFGDDEELKEIIERLHMTLFLFVVIFLVLCLALVRFGTRVQHEWFEFEKSAVDIPSVLSEYVIATEPSQSWLGRLSWTRSAAARKAEREMAYLSLRQRFMDYRSNHPDEEIARQLARDFQLQGEDCRFPFHSYLKIISGEVMGRLIEIDMATWIALDVILVVLLVCCWAAGPDGEVAILTVSGFLLIALNEFVYRRVHAMRELLTPSRLQNDAERVRRDTEWRALHELPPLAIIQTNNTWLLEGQTSSNGMVDDGQDLIPAYLKQLPHEGREMSTKELEKYQRSLILGGGRGDGVKFALFSTRLVFLLTALHFSVFLLRELKHIKELYGGSQVLVTVLYLLFLTPTFTVPSMSARIAREGLLAFNVEHMKNTRTIVLVARLLRARQTLRTLRFVAEMKIHLRESSRFHNTEGIVKLLATAKNFKFPQRFTAKDTTNSSNSSRYASREKRGDAYHREMRRREIHTVFCLFDVDGSGTVSRGELASLLLAITHDLDENQLNRLMLDLMIVGNSSEGGDSSRSLSLDTPQEVTFEAFHNWCSTRIQESALSKEGIVEEIFGMINADGSGAISVDEFVSIFETLGEVLDHEDVRELVYQMDRNGDGKIDIEEFRHMMQKHVI